MILNLAPNYYVISLNRKSLRTIYLGVPGLVESIEKHLVGGEIIKKQFLGEDIIPKRLPREGKPSVAILAQALCLAPDGFLMHFDGGSQVKSIVVEVLFTTSNFFGVEHSVVLTANEVESGSIPNSYTMKTLIKYLSPGFRFLSSIGVSLFGPSRND